jgi:hypothetical protein
MNTEDWYKAEDYARGMYKGIPVANLSPELQAELQANHQRANEEHAPYYKMLVDGKIVDNSPEDLIERRLSQRIDHIGEAYQDLIFYEKMKEFEQGGR